LCGGGDVTNSFYARGAISFAYAKSPDLGALAAKQLMRTCIVCTFLAIVGVADGWFFVHSRSQIFACIDIGESFKNASIRLFLNSPSCELLIAVII
jgi:hypothetical protein